MCQLVALSSIQCGSVMTVTKQTAQHTQAVSFLKKKLPQVGFEPTTLYMYMYTTPTTIPLAVNRCIHIWCTLYTNKCAYIHNILYVYCMTIIIYIHHVFMQLHLAEVRQGGREERPSALAGSKGQAVRRETGV